MDLFDILRKTGGYLFLVVRSNKFLEYKGENGDSRINYGLYRVSEILCRNEEELSKIISNFSHVLEDDDNAMLTCDEITAYSLACDLNQRVQGEIVEKECSLGRRRDNMSQVYSFEADVLNKCDVMISKRRVDKV